MDWKKKQFSFVANARSALHSTVSPTDSDAQSNSILIAIDVELNDEIFLEDVDGDATLVVSVLAVYHGLLSSYPVSIRTEFTPDRYPVVLMDLTSYFLVPREAMPG